MNSIFIYTEPRKPNPQIRVYAIPFDSHTGIITSDLFSFFPNQTDFVDQVAAAGLLDEFSEWVRKYPLLEKVWAEDPTHDIVQLVTWYQITGLPVPWASAPVRGAGTVCDIAEENGWEIPQAQREEQEGSRECVRQVEKLVSALRFFQGL